MNGRVNFFESDGKIYIQIEDSDADIACSVSISPENFGKALVGLSSQECTIHYIKQVLGGNGGE